MAFAQASDAQLFVDGSLVTFSDTSSDPNYIGPEEASAEQTIRAYLTNRVPAAVMATWDTPAHTPELIRDIAGRLIASIRFQAKVSASDDTVNGYAQLLYTQAMNMLSEIITGVIAIPEVPPDTLIDTRHLTEAMFWPNSNADNTDTNLSSSGNGSDIRFRMGNDF